MVFTEQWDCNIRIRLPWRGFQRVRACTSLYRFKLGPLMHIACSSAKDPLSNLDMGGFRPVSGLGLWWPKFFTSSYEIRCWPHSSCSWLQAKFIIADARRNSSWIAQTRSTRAREFSVPSPCRGSTSWPGWTTTSKAVQGCFFLVFCGVTFLNANKMCSPVMLAR